MLQIKNHLQTILLTILLTILVTFSTLSIAIGKGEIQFFTFKNGLPEAEVGVYFKGKLLGKTAKDGSLLIELPAGKQKVQLIKIGQLITSLTLNIENNEEIELIIPITQQAKVEAIISESNQQETLRPDKKETKLAKTKKRPKETATLIGNITSLETKAGVPNVNIYITGIAKKIVTDANGHFSINIPVGEYSLSAVHGDYSSQTIKHLKLTKNFKTTQNIELTPAAEQLEEFIVTAPSLEGGILALVAEKRNTSAVAEVISAEEFSKSGDSSAAAALSRVTGLTLVDGKYIFVRGMGDRYSLTRLNNASIPSPEPSKRVVPLDMFPTGMIGSILVQKTYSPNLPADFGGGAVLMRTKPIPLEKKYKLTIGIGGNTQTTFQNGLGYQGGETDFLGIDNGTRALKNSYKKYLSSPEEKGSSADLAMLDKIGKGINNNYSTHKQTILPDVSIKYSVGDRYEEYLGDTAWGYNFAVNYSRKSNYIVEKRQDDSKPSAEFTPELERKYKTKTGTNLSMMNSLIYENGDNHLYDATTIISRSTSNTTYLDTSFSSDGAINTKQYGLQWEERQLLSQQIKGKHIFPKQNDIEVEWQATAAIATRNSPDSRTYEFVQQAEHENQPKPNDYTYRYQGNTNTRTWEELTDISNSVTIDLTNPIYDFYGIFGKLKTGLLMETKDRKSDVYKLSWNTRNLKSKHPDLLETEHPEDIFVDDNIGTEFQDIKLVNTTQPTDSYTANQNIYASYLMADLTLKPYLKIMAGVRYEVSDQTIKTYLDSAKTQLQKNKLAEGYFLPSLNLTLPYRDSEQFRIGYSKTINRPDLKELSKSTYIDPDTRDYFIGNPNLKIAQITNIDLRWEKYLSSFENISFALFRKDFTYPIEVVSLPSTDADRNAYFTYSNVEKAINQGVEIQSRFWLKRLLGKTFESFYMDTNITVTDSEINLKGASNNLSTNTERALQGQSPWIININIGYEDLVNDITANLLFNQKGDSISRAGTKESPTANFGVDDTYLVAPPSLDFVYSQRIYWGSKDKLNVKFKVKNILDGEYKERIKSSIQKSYKKGTSFKIDFTYSWI